MCAVMTCVQLYDLHTSIACVKKIVCVSFVHTAQLYTIEVLVLSYRIISYLFYYIPGYQLSGTQFVVLAEKVFE